VYNRLIPWFTEITPPFREADTDAESIHSRRLSMPANIEIKARVKDLPALRRRAESVSDTPVQVIPQEDTFFNAPQGRLKLRQLGPQRGQLVYYQRGDSNGPKRSDYLIAETADPAALKAALSAALGVRGVVRKTRFLYLAGQTRIHLDQVEGLGDFMELEVVMRPDQTDTEGQAIAADLMVKLGVSESDLLEGAYMDLLEKQG
jgi:predicted adenylyl cyclase CyaB